MDFDQFTKILDFQDFSDTKTQILLFKIKFCKISLIQNFRMVSENAFPAFKPAALTGKAAAKYKHFLQFPRFAGFPMDFDEIQHFEVFL